MGGGVIVQGRVLPPIMPIPPPRSFKQLRAQKVTTRLALADPWSEAPNGTLELATDRGVTDRAPGGSPDPPTPFGLLTSRGKRLSGDEGDCILSLKQS